MFFSTSTSTSTATSNCPSLEVGKRAKLPLYVLENFNPSCVRAAVEVAVEINVFIKK
jgi:hypothetical protein